MIILGIDPGTALTGYGVIKTTRNRHDKPKVIDFGCIVTDISTKPEHRLKAIHYQVHELIKAHEPEVISIENLYFFKNLKTAMPVSQAKGVVLLAAAQNNIPILEFTPLQVKMTVVGYGKAEKKQVQAMTKQLLDLSAFNLEEKSRKKDDATDALGIALCAFLSKSEI